MKTKKFLVWCILFTTLNSISQCDLTLTSVSLSPLSLGEGQTFTLTLDIKNIGLGASSNCKVGIYLSPTISFTDAVLYQQISLQVLPANGNTIPEIVYPIPYNYGVGNKYVYVFIDDGNAVPELNESNNRYYLTPPLNILPTPVAQQNIPYPMIFIHGLNSNSKTWDYLLSTYQSFYGWTYGGQMNFCLNQDGNNATSLFNDYYDWTNSSAISKGDFYTINFDVNPNGSVNTGTATFNSVLSNQSAISRQGYAVRDAINRVLQITGRDKVILVGHSMGGLASREYIQNSNLWQADGKHHIAKLFTVGTPHGGSDQVTVGMADCQSEAYRDLRTSYSGSSLPGVYLFGGTESNAVCNLSFCSNFYNVDVNCNGITGETPTGLNYKPISNNLSYACIIGVGSSLGGDGAVAEPQANLNNYYTLNADTFRLFEPAGSCVTGCIWHTLLPRQVKAITKGIDESLYFQTAYDVSPLTTYYGIISKQSATNPIQTDYDDYRINVGASGNLNMKIMDIYSPQLKLEVFDAAYNSIYSIFSNGQSYLNVNTNVNPGIHYIEISAVPDDYTWYFPYAFILDYQPSFASINEISLSNGYFESINYPNPFSDFTTIRFVNKEEGIINISIYDISGKLVSEVINENKSTGEHRVEFSSKDLESGLYFYTIKSNNYRETHKMVISK